MKQFSTQFATQKLRETLNEVKFTIDDSDLYSAVMDRYMRGASVQDMLIKDEGDYLETDEETFQGVQAIAMDLEKVDALVRLDGIEEMSATGAGANFVPGTGEQYATPKVFKKIVKKKIKEGASSEFIVNKVWDFLETRPFYNKEYMPKFNTAKEIYDEFGQKELELYSNFDWKGDSSKIHPREKAALQRRANYDALKGSVEEGDVEPKLAAGPADIYMKKKWGWKEAPSIPNRPSKGGFIYKQMFEGFKRNDQLMITRKGRETGPYRIKGVHTYPNGSQLLSIETPKKNQLYLSIGTDGKAKYSTGEEAYIKPLNENYSRFKKETNETEWPSEIPSRYGEYIFKLINVMPDGAKYDVIDAETGKKEPGGRAYRSVETLKNAAADLVKPKGGTQSTQLEENTNIPENIVNFAKKKGISAELNMIANWVEKAGKRIVGGTAIGKNYNTLILDLTHQGSEIYYNMDNESIEVNGQPVDSYEEFLEALTVVDGSLNENYSRFKKETKTRTNEQQLHAAMRLAEKKIHEANRILEYTAQLRTELKETKTNKNTQKLMEKITRGIAEAYGKMKKLK